jgi:thiol-disulfide isomerase/thioredoxin
MRSTATFLTLAIVAGLSGTSAQPGPRFDRVYELKPAEGVFAYARISPDGNVLAYASENGNARTVTVVDLKTKQTLFTESGIDAYWSNDGKRMIFLSNRSGVTIRHHDTGAVTRTLPTGNLGDYFSWAVRDGRNLILTIDSNFYYLDGDQPVLPHGRVPSCPGIGVGERPLISKDGRRITTFVRGAVVIRGLTDCDGTLDTGIQGAKADFSWDGRYVAFHVQKTGAKGYEIQVVDTQKRTVRTVTNLAGSSLFPSWTQDGRLNFRYDGDDYRGFITASNVLSVPERPLPTGPTRVQANARWQDLFPETPAPRSRVNFVMVWATWSAHSPDALVDLQRAGRHFRETAADVSVFTALETGSLRADVERMRRANNIDLPEIPLAPDRLARTEALNQIPTTLLFKDGVVVDRRLGAQTYDALVAWAGAALGTEAR